METQQFIRHDRVRKQTASYVNERIDLLTHANIELAETKSRDEMEKRVMELDREWDVDRALMLNFSILGGSAYLAGMSGRKKLSYLLGAQLFFLGLHAVKGWCPPLPVFRRMGFRTRHEIDAEKHHLLRKLEQQGGLRKVS